MPDLASRPVRPALWSDRDSQPTSYERPSLLPLLVLALLMAGYAWLFGWLSLSRYWAYEMHALDMGNMSQAAWNTVHGHPYWFTNMRLPYSIEAWRTTTRLSFHVEALFPVISLVYLIWPRPESLLILQTAALTAGAVAVYLLARDILQSAWLAIVFVLVYLLFPALEAMNLYEFHPVSLATPLLLFAFWFARRRHYALFVLCCLAAMGTKEEIGLVVAMLGLYVALVNRQWPVGLSMAAVGAAWSLFAVLVVEHHFRQPGTVTYVRNRYGYLEKYGHGIHGVLETVLHHPGDIVQVVFAWPKLGYLQRLLAPVGYTALLAPLILLIGLPSFAINLLSSDFHMFSGLGDNSAELIAVIVIAGILGTRLAISLLGMWLPGARASLAMACFVLIMALVNQHVNGYTPLGAFYQVPTVTYHQRLANHFVSMVPAGVPVSTQDQLDPHLSSRHDLYLFPDTGRADFGAPALSAANYILLDASAPTYPLPSYQLHDYAQSWIHRPGWGIAAAKNGLILIKKGAARQTVPPQFYTYLWASGGSMQHRLQAQQNGLQIIGYSVAHTDLPNHFVPNLAYTFYLRPSRPVAQNLRPVVFEVLKGSMIGCVPEPLGLAWFPTSNWSVGHTYQVRMEPLETSIATPGTAHLSVELVPTPAGPHPDCAALWHSHGHLWSAGQLTIQF